MALLSKARHPRADRTGRSSDNTTFGRTSLVPIQRRRTDSERLRVLVVTESFLPQVNGVTNSVRRVLEHLAAEGHVAQLVAPTGPETYAGFPVAHARGASLPFYREFRIGLETRRRLRAEMLRFQPDVVHLASPATLGFQAARAARDLGIPTVAVYQTDLVGFAQRYAVPGGAAAMSTLTRRIHSVVDLTLAPSTASIDQLERMDVPRVARWPRGVDLEMFDPAHRSEDLHAELAPDGELLVGYVGRLAPEKELELLTHVAKIPGVRVVVVGGGPEEERLRRLLPGAAFLGVLHGDDLSRAYATLDVFVHTGRHETYCQSAQEALASGVPVVAPRSGGPIDVVDDGVAGHLYQPGNGTELRRYVEALVADPALRARVAQAAWASVRDRSWQAVNHRLVEHYRDVIGVSRGGESGLVDAG